MERREFNKLTLLSLVAGLPSVAAEPGCSATETHVPPAPPPPVDPPPPLSPSRRLVHFQPVGFSSRTGLGQVSPRVCHPQRGWQVHVDSTLRPLVDQLGHGAFDWWGHRIGGTWTDAPIQLDDRATTRTEFEQLDLARTRFPALVDFGPLASFARGRGLELYGYIGFPRCDQLSATAAAPRPEHAHPGSMNRWYGEFVKHRFKGVGHDWTQNLPSDSAVLQVNFPFLRSHGIEPFIEAIPERKNQHLLGWSVVVTETRLQFTETRPDLFFTREEILAAGGRIIVIVAHPPRGGVADLWRWRFERAAARLDDGWTVAVNLPGLRQSRHPIRQLAELARAGATRPPAAPGHDR